MRALSDENLRSNGVFAHRADKRPLTRRGRPLAARRSVSCQTFSGGKSSMVWPCRFQSRSPAPAPNVGNGIVADKVVAALKLFLHDAIKAVHFIGVTRDGIGQLFGPLTRGNDGLPPHEPKPSDLPEHPLITLDTVALV